MRRLALVPTGVSTASSLVNACDFSVPWFRGLSPVLWVQSREVVWPLCTAIYHAGDDKTAGSRVERTSDRIDCDEQLN